MSKYELIKKYDEMKEGNNNILRNKLFNLIVKNGWLEYYNEKFSNEYGL